MILVSLVRTGDGTQASSRIGYGAKFPVPVSRMGCQRQTRKPRLCMTTMSNPYLPTELLDHIADLLHDTSDALKSCCLISKSWIPRTRKHLFADVKFRTPTNLSTWKNTFPDPSTSPACYTGSLFIKYPQPITPADAEEGGWITTFSRVVRFGVDIHQSTVDLVPFHAFSPAIKSLHITFLRLPPIQILDLAYSFPSLEDLSLSSPTWSYYGLNAELTATPPPNPPAFTGSLELFLWGGMSPIASQLLALPSGLHFRRLKLTLRRGGDISSTMELVERCSSTLETLEIDFKAARTSILHQHKQWRLTFIYRLASGFDQPLESNETQRGCICLRLRCRMDHYGTTNYHTQPPRFSTALNCWTQDP